MKPVDQDEPRQVSDEDAGRGPLRTVLAVLILPVSLGLALAALVVTVLAAARRMGGSFKGLRR
jgi:hypothetical protein